jgi:site-specific recombinase
MQRYTPTQRKKIALFFENNLGAIVGNLFLGFALGMAGNMGEFIGIPFDIRHITISAGNLGIALLNFKFQDWELILTVFVSVILIGLINIIVSFLISFILACSSRGLSWKQSIKLLFSFQ